MSGKEKDVELSQAEISLRQAELVDQISRLVDAKGRGYTLATFANEIGLSVSAVSASQNHRRWWGRTSRESIELIARALGTSVAQVYFWAGILTAPDFVPAETLDERLELIFSLMSRDAAMSGICPPRAKWISWPIDAKMALGMLYEQRPGGIKILDAASPQRIFSQGLSSSGNDVLSSNTEQTQAGRATQLAQAIGLYTMGVLPSTTTTTVAFEILEELGRSLDTSTHASRQLLELAQKGIALDAQSSPYADLVARARSEIFELQRLSKEGLA